MFKGKKNTSIRLKLQRMRKKSVRKKIQNGGSSSISTSDQQQPDKSHHISYLSTDEIRNLQVNFYILKHRRCLSYKVNLVLRKSQPRDETSI